MNDDKTKYQESAENHRAAGDALAKEGHASGSETMKRDCYDKALTEYNIAETLDNVANRIKP